MEGLHGKFGNEGSRVIGVSMKTISFLLGVILMTGSLGIANVAGAETIVVKKTIPVSVETAWELWTNPDKLKSWLTNDANHCCPVRGIA